MAQKLPIYQVEISDRPGSLYKMLAAAAEAEVDLVCLSAVSKGGGKGVAYLGPKDPRAAKKFFAAQGLKVKELVAFVLNKKDRCGAGADALKKLAEKKIKGVACIATKQPKGKCQILFAVDKKDSAKVTRALK